MGKINLIIDGNYILNRNVFILFKYKLLYSDLENSLHKNLENYTRWYNFDNIYLVADKRGHSWRKKMYPEYKAQRKKNSKIDWDFVFNSYELFKDNLPKNVTLLEREYIEGDDWISHLVRRGNNNGVSNLIVSNDHDIKQLLGFDLDKMCINFMTNEMSDTILFMPDGYQTFLSEYSKTSRPVDLFDLDDDMELYRFIKSFGDTRSIENVNPDRELVVKLVMGDKSDNISCVWKNGKGIGIGKVGADKIYKLYVSQYGDVDITSENFYDDLTTVIMDVKKVSLGESDGIIENLKMNMNLINLSRLPKKVTSIMENRISEISNGG